MVLHISEAEGTGWCGRLRQQMEGRDAAEHSREHGVAQLGCIVLAMWLWASDFTLPQLSTWRRRGLWPAAGLLLRSP